MILDVPLSASHTQAVKIHEHFPALWKIANENARALWFHRSHDSVARAKAATPEPAQEKNLLGFL